MIEFPKTLRPARVDEVPKNSSVLERLQKIANAKIIEGYTFQLKDVNNKENGNIPFNFYAEININNSRLWDLIIALVELLPDVSALIIGHCDLEPNYGTYINKNDLIERISKFKEELILDTFIEWGIIYQDNVSLTEIFISDSKYLKFWGVDSKTFKEIMTKFNLEQINDLEFIDEYPKVRIPLKSLDNSVTNTSDLINELKKI